MEENTVLEQQEAQTPETSSFPSDSSGLPKVFGGITAEQLSERILNELPRSVRSQLKGETDIKELKKRLQMLIEDANGKVDETYKKRKGGLDIQYAMIGMLFAMGASLAHAIIMYFVEKYQMKEVKDLQRIMKNLEVGEKQINSTTMMFEAFCDDFGLPTLPPEKIREVTQEAIEHAFQECEKEIAADKDRDKDKEEQTPDLAPA